MKRAAQSLEYITGESMTMNDLLELTDLIANAVKTAKLSKPQGKPLGSSRPARIRGVGMSVAQLIRDGRR